VNLMKELLPVMFVGSSLESSRYVSIIEEILGGIVTIRAWNQNVFDPTLSNFLSDIIDAIETSNSALFIFTPDDKRIMRDVEASVVRDNVVFEAGMAIGILGRQRTFILSQDKTVVPSDLEGLTVFRFKADGKGSYEADLRNQLHILKDRLIQTDLLRKSPVYLGEYVSDRIYEGVKQAKTIWAVGPLLSSFLETYEFEIAKRLADEANPLEKLVAVLRDPWGATKNLVSIHPVSHSKSISVYKRITASIEILQKLRFAHPEQVEIHVLDHPFMCSSYVFDAETVNCNICIQYNPFGDVARLPQLFVPANRRFWNNFYVDQAKEYIWKSKRYPAVYTVKRLKGIAGNFEEEKPILELWQKGYQKIGYRGDESASRRLNDETLLVLAKDNGKLVGFSLIDTLTGKRRGTVVDHQHRKRGIATDIVRESLKIVNPQYSEVNVDSIQMRSVLERNGFRQVKTQAEVLRIVKNEGLEFKYDAKSDQLLYRRKRSFRTNGELSEWLILYQFST